MDDDEQTEDSLGRTEKISRGWKQSRLAALLSSESEQATTYPPSWYCNGTLRHEARETIENQTEWLQQIDSKAMKTLRFNTLILGLILPTFSFAVKHEFISKTADLQNQDLMFGIIFLLSSTALSGVTYTSSNIDTGISAKDIKTAQRKNLSDKEVHDSLLHSYRLWMSSNSRAISWNTLLITCTILLMVYGLVFLSLGTTTAVLGSVPLLVRTVAYVGLFVVTIVSIVL